MSKEKAIEILKSIRELYEDSPGCTLYRNLSTAIEELEEEDRDKSPCIIDQEYRLKCDWCGGYLEKTRGVITDDSGNRFDSWKCQMAYDDHQKIADLMTWRDKLMNALLAAEGKP